ncbi:MAG TPA: hypothetical protein VMA97_14845 [Streptosporangiaceae bacterium]|nr:hypothetical protein [Streptosporangiaceae bacterium]
MDLQLERQFRTRDADGIQEEQKERNEFWIAVRERDPIHSPVRLVLRALAPVGDGACDQDLAVGQVADTGGGCGIRRRSSCGADRPLGSPVPTHPF